MYYIFREFWAGNQAIFDDKEKCDRFVKDFLIHFIEDDAECPREGDDYSVSVVNTMNPTFKKWYNED